MQQKMAEFVGNVKPAPEKPALGPGEANEWSQGDARRECINVADP